MVISKVSNNPILKSEVLGAAFTILHDALFMTPMFTDDSYDDDDDSWIEVDFMSVLSEEEYIWKELDRVDIILRNKLNMRDIKVSYP